LKDPIQYVTTRRALGNVLYSNPNLLCLNAGYVNRVGFRLFTKWEETVPLYLFIISGLMLKHNIAHRYAINPEKDATEWETISIPSHTLPKGYRQCLAIGMQDSSNTTQIYAAVPALYIGILVENIMKIKRYLGQILICMVFLQSVFL
ncbi:unnamed protein product, partial [Rotaria magnacalcarata]